MSQLVCTIAAERPSSSFWKIDVGVWSSHVFQGLSYRLEIRVISRAVACQCKERVRVRVMISVRRFRVSRFR